MQHPRHIHVDGQPVAVAVPDGDGIRFVAVKFEVWSLDDTRYPTIEDAVRAATLVARKAERAGA